MTIRNDVVRDCGGFIFGLSGWNGTDVPKIHGNIRLENNVFENVRGPKWFTVGVKDFQLK